MVRTQITCVTLFFLTRSSLPSSYCGTWFQVSEETMGDHRSGQDEATDTDSQEPRTEQSVRSRSTKPPTYPENEIRFLSRIQLQLATGPPEWLSECLAEAKSKYPGNVFSLTSKRGASGQEEVEWRIRCLDCPGKVPIFVCIPAAFY
jgi:hypothetical protein